MTGSRPFLFPILNACLSQTPAAFGGVVHPVVPGSRHSAGTTTAAAGSAPLGQRRLFATKIGRAGRSGPDAAWPGARFNLFLRVVPRKGAGK